MRTPACAYKPRASRDRVHLVHRARQVDAVIDRAIGAKFNDLGEAPPLPSESATSSSASPDRDADDGQQAQVTALSVRASHLAIASTCTCIR
jgi:hypothetical protein